MGLVKIEVLLPDKELKEFKQFLKNRKFYNFGFVDDELNFKYILSSLLYDRLSFYLKHYNFNKG